MTILYFNVFNNFSGTFFPYLFLRGARGQIPLGGFLLLSCTPGIHNQCNRNDAVAQECPEILAHSRIAEQDGGGALASRLQSIRLMSRDALFADGNREGYIETYHYFAAFVGLLLLGWLFLTIYRGGVA